MKNVLVTGGAGFVGSHLVETLVKKGINVTVIDDFSNGNKENLNSCLEKIKLINFDVSNSDWSLLNEITPDTIFHLATHPRSFSLSDPKRNLEVNVLGTLNVLEFAKKNNSKFIYTSNSGICGEPKFFPVTEEHPEDCKTPYDANKLIGEHYAKIYHEIYGIYITIFRLAAVYGERQKVNESLGWRPLVATLVQKIISDETPSIQWDGNQTRDLIYVKDVVNGLIKGAESNEHAGMMFLLSTNKETSVNQVFDMICKLTKKEITPKYEEKNLGDLRRMILSYDKAKLAFDYTPEFSLKDGVLRYIEWLKKTK
jgi:UDP-glucose 4-epimerase